MKQWQGFWVGLTAGMLMAGLAGCVKSETDGGENASGRIRFAAATESRAVVDETNPMQEFNVWGYYVSSEGGKIDVFGQAKGDGVLVSDVGGGTWQYEGTRYWVPEVKYDFHAVYPNLLDEVKLSAEIGLHEDNEGNRYLAIAGFDASEHIGDKAVDLMMATKRDVVYREGGENTVGLEFHHLLARVEFVGRVDEASAGIEGFSAEIVSASLYGMHKTGSFSAEGIDLSRNEEIQKAWTLPGITGGNPSTEEEPFANFDETAGNLSEEGLSVFGDLLMFPQSLTRDFYVRIKYKVNGVEKDTGPIALISMAVTEWEAGMHYRYTFTVSDDERILFDTPTVNEWGEASGGIIIVD